MIKVIISLLNCLLLFACSNSVSNDSLNPSQQLKKVIQTESNYRKNSDPFNHSAAVGAKAKLPDLSAQSLAKNNQQLSKIYQSLQNIHADKLTQSEQINLAVLSYSLKNELDSYHFKAHYMPLTAESGFHVWIASIRYQVKMSSEQDFKDYLARLKALPRYFDQQMAWMNKGISAGITQPQVVLKGFEQSIKAFIKKDPTQSSYYQPFKSLPKHLSKSVQIQLRAQAQNIITSAVIPSYQKYYHYMIEQYQPNARKNIAATSLPNGDAFYKNRVDHYTTLNMSIEEIHQLGLIEVSRIRHEMTAIIKQLKFKGSFADFLRFLRTDPQFYAKTPRDLLKEASYIAKKMDGKLPSLFKTLPRVPYGIDPVPANIAPKYTTGRYSSPSRDDQAGSYWVNTYRLDRRPLYVLPALTLHEAVPGHHLQGALASEMHNVPEFRNNTYISAFGEGWGLYSEFLGIEAGIYETPYQDFGRLTYEMWRACRLVVDTGMHAQGWSRERAMDYLAANTALSLHNVKTEIDRYISWPGQALSYKIGELTIKRLRKEAEQALGEKFDLRNFHDQILKNGSMPLSILEIVIDKYIQQQAIES
ncbi:MAG: DUF885 domain-containing protein [Gammaproteobacteria bacterium]|nr:MAG: DUF885 domain-containing protein [Gammaproteobacteria bacterium]